MMGLASLNVYQFLTKRLIENRDVSGSSERGIRARRARGGS